MEKSLKVIKQKLQDNLTHLNWTSDQYNQGGQAFIKVGGLIKVRHVITEIEPLDLFETQVYALKNSIIFTSTNEQMQIQHAEGIAIINHLNNLKQLISNFLTVLTQTIPTEDENSINIKLPEVNDFEELSKVSHDIHVSLTQVIYNKEINGQTKIVSVENGSIWINVFIGSGAVAVVGSLVWASAVIFKKIQEGKLLEAQVKALNVKNESIQDILKAQKEETKLMIQAEAEFIQSTHFKENAPENIERIKNSIKTLAELIEKGAEIHPALVAPEQVTNLFPDPKNLIGLESKIKKIGS